MSIFLTLYLAIYGGMNAYLFWKVRLAFRLGPWISALLAAALIGLVLMPFIIRWMEHRHAVDAARILAWVGLTWMGVALWFFTVGLLLDAGLGLLRGLHALWGTPGPAVSPFLSGLVTLGLTLILLVTGLIENRCWRLRTVEVAAPAETRPAAPIRILLISDVHLGLLETDLYLNNIERAVAESRPDLILSAGDLFDGRGDPMPEAAARLARLSAPLGKFAVLGNHEFYAGLADSLRFHEAAGFTLLRGDTRTLETNGWSLVLAGIDFPARGVWGQHAQVDDALTGPRRAGAYQVLLKHLPVPSDRLGTHYQLQLSGHTHGGQILPFNLAVRALYPHLQGLFPLADGQAHLYVSRGTGSWGPPLRLGPRREITLLIVR